jgi:hypothetical protein
LAGRNFSLLLKISSESGHKITLNEWKLFSREMEMDSLREDYLNVREKSSVTSHKKSE